MPNWRAMLAGVATFLAGIPLTLSYTPPAVLLAGFLGGAAAGVVAGGLRSGLWHGALVGVASLLLVVLGLVVALALHNPEYARPGLGYSIVLVPVVGVAYAVEATVAGAVSGGLRGLLR